MVFARIFLTWLLLAVLAAPSLGRLHALLHVGAEVSTTSITMTSPLRQPPRSTAAKSAFAALLAEHPGAADCLLFDHLALADAAPSVTWALAVGLPPAPPVWAALPAPTLQRLVAFHARAPPQRA